MKDKIKKYLNLYVVVGFIAFFSFLYIISFVFVLNDVANGSSTKMQERLLKKQEQEKLNQ